MLRNTKKYYFARLDKWERNDNIKYWKSLKENEANSRKMKDLQRKNTDLKNQNEITEEVNRDMSEELTNLKQILEHERRLRNRFF